MPYRRMGFKPSQFPMNVYHSYQLDCQVKKLSDTMCINLEVRRLDTQSIHDDKMHGLPHIPSISSGVPIDGLPNSSSGQQAIPGAI